MKDSILGAAARYPQKIKDFIDQKYGPLKKLEIWYSHLHKNYEFHVKGLYNLLKILPDKKIYIWAEFFVIHKDWPLIKEVLQCPNIRVYQDLERENFAKLFKDIPNIHVKAPWIVRFAKINNLPNIQALQYNDIEALLKKKIPDELRIRLLNRLNNFEKVYYILSNKDIEVITPSTLYNLITKTKTSCDIPHLKMLLKKISLFMFRDKNNYTKHKIDIEIKVRKFYEKYKNYLIEPDVNEETDLDIDLRKIKFKPLRHLLAQLVPAKNKMTILKNAIKVIKEVNHDSNQAH